MNNIDIDMKLSNFAMKYIIQFIQNSNLTKIELNSNLINIQES